MEHQPRDILRATTVARHASHHPNSFPASLALDSSSSPPLPHLSPNGQVFLCSSRLNPYGRRLAVRLRHVGRRHKRSSPSVLVAHVVQRPSQVWATSMLGRDLTVSRLYQDRFVRSVVYLFVLDRTPYSIPQLPLLHQPLTVVRCRVSLALIDHAPTVMHLKNIQ